MPPRRPRSRPGRPTARSSGDADPSAYYYRYARARRPRTSRRCRGSLARLLLEPFGGGMRAHEHTMAGPKADRLALLHATRTQLSPILAIYFDRSTRYDHVMGRPWADEWRARDGDGLLHSLAALEPDERLLSYLSRQQLYLADGHHRYETALAYQAEVRADPARADAAPGSLAADWIMVVLVNAEREELEIQATHRLIREADDDALRSLVREPGPDLAGDPGGGRRTSPRASTSAARRRAAGLRAGAAGRRGIPAGRRCAMPPTIACAASR